MDDQITKKIKDDLKRLISQARKENKWIHCKYQDLWFAPDELEKTNKEYKFLWDVGDFTLRDPQEHINEIQKQIDELGKQLAEIHARLHR